MIEQENGAVVSAGWGGSLRHRVKELVRWPSVRCRCLLALGSSARDLRCVVAGGYREHVCLSTE